MTKRSREWMGRLLAGIAVGLIALPALTAEPCSAFIWDVRQERALFASTPQAAAAGANAVSAAALVPDHLYQLTLMPQPQVTFAAPPGKRMLTDGAFAGVVAFQVTAPGTYRIALDQPFWIDVVLEGHLLASKDFQGAPDCAPHKIVEFDLPAGKQLLLQFSGATSPTTRVTITRAPAPKA